MRNRCCELRVTPLTHGWYDPHDASPTRHLSSPVSGNLSRQHHGQLERRIRLKGRLGVKQHARSTYVVCRTPAPCTPVYAITKRHLYQEAAGSHLGLHSLAGHSVPPSSRLGRYSADGPHRYREAKQYSTHSPCCLAMTLWYHENSTRECY